jgi:DnaK suppressor protein
MTHTHVTDKISQDRCDMLRGMLEERRQEIQSKLHSMLETAPDEATLVRDAEEQSVTDFVRAVDLTLMQMKSETLSKIDEALRRLEEGTYGACLECGRPIPEARLSALPFAERCRDCQERHETMLAMEQTDARQDTSAIGTRLRDAMVLARDQEAKQ